MEETRFFVDLGIVLAAAVLGGIFAHLARQPLIVGYILGGILVNPFTPGPAVSDIHAFEFFAEFGVVLLMFSMVPSSPFATCWTPEKSRCSVLRSGSPSSRR